jgi:hypothetical protein
MFDKKMVRGFIAALTATMLAGTAHGSLIAFDDFAYPAGSSLAGQNGGQGFSGAWYAGGFNVSQSVSVTGSSSLTYPPLTTAGNEVTTPATSFLNGVERNLSSPISSGTIYLSCLLCPVGSLNQGNGNGFFGLYLHGSVDDMFMGQFNLNGTDHYGESERGGNGAVTTPGTPVVGQTEFLVLEAQLASSGADVFTLYSDPTPGAPQPSSGTVYDLNIGILASLNIYSGGAFNIGDLTIGTTYADVTAVPEPSTLALLIVGAAGLLAFAWRRKHAT